MGVFVGQVLTRTFPHFVACLFMLSTWLWHSSAFRFHETVSISSFFIHGLCFGVKSKKARSPWFPPTVFQVGYRIPCGFISIYSVRSGCRTIYSLWLTAGPVLAHWQHAPHRLALALCHEPWATCVQKSFQVLFFRFCWSRCVINQYQ